MNNFFLSVVIPSYNESENIKRGVLGAIEDYLRRKGYKHEVIIVDDGSTDESAELLKEELMDERRSSSSKNSFRLIKNSHSGKAVTVMTGMLQARGDIILFTDMDQATPIRELEKLLPEFSKGFDIVIGSRKGREGAPAVRKLMAWGFSTLRTIILGLPYKDTQCGFKAFSKKAVREIFPMLLENWKSKKVRSAAVNAGFDVETLFVAKQKDLKIKEVLVDWHHVGTERVQAVSDSLEALFDMLRIRINDIRGRYN